MSYTQYLLSAYYVLGRVMSSGNSRGIRDKKKVKSELRDMRDYTIPAWGI